MLPTRLLVVLSACVLVGAQASAAVPRVKWAFAARSNLYGSPIVADVHPSPGQETIVSDAEARLVRCVSAKGKLLWTFGGGWVRRVVNVPSLSLKAQPGRALLVVGCADRLLQCIDARDGKRVWARHVGGLDWGTAVWADLDGDGRDEVVAGTRADGIVALGARGRKLWRYRGEDAAHPIRIGGPIAASDVDGDGKAEVFACTSLGPVCVGGDGKLRWSRLTGDGWPGAPLIADLDGDGAAEVVCASNEENAL